MRLTVDVTNPELDALEDVLMVWNLCPRHIERSVKATRWAKIRWQNTCPECIRTFDEKVDKSLKLWSKLCRAYDMPKSAKRPG